MHRPRGADAGLNQPCPKGGGCIMHRTNAASHPRAIVGCNIQTGSYRPGIQSCQKSCNVRHIRRCGMQRDTSERLGGPALANPSGSASTYKMICFQTAC